jgi:hypothetical protein
MLQTCTSTRTWFQKKGGAKLMMIPSASALTRIGHGVGEGVTPMPDRTINYDGKETSVKVQP